MKRLKYIERHRQYFKFGNYLIKTPKWVSFNPFKVLNCIVSTIKANLEERDQWKNHEYDRQFLMPYYFSILFLISVFKCNQAGITLGEYLVFTDNPIMKQNLDLKWDCIHIDSFGKYEGKIKLMNYGCVI